MTKVKLQQDRLYTYAAPNKTLLETIDKTRAMCSQFNFAV